MNQNFDILIVGGGAAGFFTAINIVEKNPSLKVAILERGSEVLNKVRISGGGRCNVTHACFEPNELVKFYPRGEKELRGPFHQFCSGDTIEWLPNETKFIRPCKDSKTFTGRVFSKIKWDDFVQQSLTNGHTTSLDINTLIQVASPKKIYKEARLWVVDGKIVTSSYYFFHGNVSYEENVEPEGLEFGQSMVDLYQVADAFVMDICLTPDGWKIVEINCVNCSGFYKGDLQKVLIALEDKFNPIK